MELFGPPAAGQGTGVELWSDMKSRNQLKQTEDTSPEIEDDLTSGSYCNIEKSNKYNCFKVSIITLNWRNLWMVFVYVVIYI